MAKRKIANPEAPYGTRADGSPRKRPGPRTRAPNSKARTIRAGDEEWGLWSEAAHARGLSLSQLIRQALNSEIARAERPDPQQHVEHNS